MNMFYQKMNRKQAAISMHCRHPRRRWNGVICCWMTSFAAYGIRWTPYNALSVGMTRQFFLFFFCPWWPWPLSLWPWHSNVRSRDQTRLPCELGANPFRGSGDTQTNKQTNKNKKSQTALKTEPYLRAVNIRMNNLRISKWHTWALELCCFQYERNSEMLWRCMSSNRHKKKKNCCWIVTKHFITTSDIISVDCIAKSSS